MQIAEILTVSGHKKRYFQRVAGSLEHVVADYQVLFIAVVSPGVLLFLIRELTQQRWNWTNVWKGYTKPSCFLK